MHCAEIIIEAHINPVIGRILSDKGYKFVDRGADQDVYLAPDGTILKIFGYDLLQGQKSLSLSQQAFIDFANFCKKNPGNPFLPEFSDWATFTYAGQTYLQIKSERLFPITGQWENVAFELQTLAKDVIDSGVKVALDRYLALVADAEKNYPENPLDAPNLLILTLGMPGLKKFVATVDQIKKIGRGRGYDLDLSYNNFMFGSDGHIVINDPYTS